MGMPGMLLSIPLTAIIKLLLDLRPRTKALGYFLGSEFTDTKNDPSKFFGKQEPEQQSLPKNNFILMLIDKYEDGLIKCRN